MVLALVLGIIGWRRFRNWRRVVSVLSVVMSAAMALTLINKQYQYYPTLGSLLGVNAQNQVSPQQLQAIRDRARGEHGGAIPTHGFTIQIPIPGKESGFVARDAFVWVPPVWVADEKVELPLIELLIGSPGEPSDWTRAAMADVTAREFADAHHGQAPIIVMPDENGSFSGDTECVNSARGNAETYLTVDVPTFMRTHFNAKIGDGSVALAGLSEGGMCAMMLTLRHPAKYPAFADYSGLTSPTLSEEVNPPATIRDLFGGSQAAYNAHDPLFLLRQQKFPQHGRLVRGRDGRQRTTRVAAHARSPGSRRGDPHLCRRKSRRGSRFHLVGAGLSRVAALPVVAARPDRKAALDHAELLALSARPYPTRATSRTLSS